MNAAPSHAIIITLQYTIGIHGTTATTGRSDHHDSACTRTRQGCECHSPTLLQLTKGSLLGIFESFVKPLDSANDSVVRSWLSSGDEIVSTT